MPEPPPAYPAASSWRQVFSLSGSWRSPSHRVVSRRLLVAASFQLVRELRKPLAPRRIPPPPRGGKFSTCPGVEEAPRTASYPAAGPAEVSFAGTFAVGRHGGADLSGRNSNARRASADPGSSIPPPCGGKFSTCPGVEEAPRTASYPAAGPDSSGPRSLPAGYVERGHGHVTNLPPRGERVYGAGSRGG